MRRRSIFAGLRLLTIIVATLVAVTTVMGFAVPSFATPALQLYIEGSTYDPVTESWFIESSPFTILVLGNIEQSGPILDVHLSLAYFATDTTSEFGSATLTPTTASTVSDPSLAPPAVLSETGPLPTSPTTGDGSPLPQHGVFNDQECGDGNGCIVRWAAYSIGDFTLTDSPIGNYIDSVPTEFPTTGQINAYQVSFPAGWLRVHFDAYDHTVDTVCNRNGTDCREQVHEYFAAFSHDASGSRRVPEPGLIGLLGVGLTGLTAFAWRTRRRTS